MSDFETRQRPSSGVGNLALGAGSGIQWIPPEVPAGAAPGAQAGGRRGRSDNTTALIVIGLTFACTVLSLFDLFQLAAGF
jgi:hypothetical protein